MESKKSPVIQGTPIFNQYKNIRITKGVTTHLIEPCQPEGIFKQLTSTLYDLLLLDEPII